MTNLLPIEYQKSIRRAVWTRAMLAASAAAILCALVAFLALVPGYLAARTAADTAPTAAKASAAAADRARIQEAQALVKELTPFTAATTSPVRMIIAAISVKPADVSLSDITYASGPSGRIMLSGDAHNPDLIAAYRDALVRDPRFTGASVPVDALVGANAGHFTMTLTGAF